jgi:hypothetical protein
LHTAKEWVIEILKRHDVQVLRRIGPARTEGVKLNGVSLGSVRRVERAEEREPYSKGQAMVAASRRHLDVVTDAVVVRLSAAIERYDDETSEWCAAISRNWTGPRGAARLLGINRSTLQFLMKKLGIERPT